ncbi:MAG: hypothetical protein HGGPFJEG_01805 [Ignavibacteria bacterium]|nr:hypothetical protein [Ignavibacteria bacterium]
MKQKLFIYLLPFVAVCFALYGFSQYDDPVSESAFTTVATDSKVMTTPYEIINGQITSRAPFVNQSDTIPPAGFPYPTVFNWNYSLIPNVSGGTVGAITMNNRFYMNRWNLATNYRYANDGPGNGPGTRVDSNTAYNAGTGAIRDLTVAPDGSGNMYLWGGSATTTLYKLDSLMNRVASYVHAGAAYRAIAWDPNRKGFWSCNFGGNIVCRDTNGTVLGTIVTSTTGKYGMGWDSSSVADSAFLWVWEQGGTTTNNLHKFNLATGTLVKTYTFTLTGASIGSAGGAEVQKIGGTTYLFLNWQNYAVTGYDLSNPISLLTNDVGTTAITRPASTIIQNVQDTPTATVQNFGSATQTFNVTMTISPDGYSSTKTVTGLSSLNSSNVVFDPYTPLTNGTKTVTVYTQLGTDQNLSNDTARKTINVYQPNYGGGGSGTGGYYYANSTSDANPAPSQPTYCWLDTAGSTSLVVNSTASIAPTNGTLDDGHWGVLIGTPRKIKFMGVTYDSIYIGSNGILGFINFVPGSGNWYPPANGLPGEGSGGLSRPALYPLWHDMNWGNTSQPVNRLSYKVDSDKNQLIVTYDRAPLYGGLATDWVTFQICIGLQADTAGAPNSNIVYSYSNSSTAINIPLLVGIQDATGSNYLQYTFINSSGTVITSGPLFSASGDGVAVAFGPDASNLNGHCKSLNLTAMFEAYWNGSSYLGDTITVDIRSGIAPYNVIETHKVTNDASGFAAIDVGVANNTNYYIVVNHRNTVRTWSQLVQWTGQTLTYDFTSAQTMAFGNNLTLNAGKWCIYTGDITKDGVVDGSDGALIDNDAANFNAGPYLITDLNWDTVVDGSDATYTDNNASNFIGEIAP